MQVLAFPNVSYTDLFKLEPKLKTVDIGILKQIQKDATYVNYLDRQRKILMLSGATKSNPESLDYNSIQGLSTELRLLLSRRAQKHASGCQY